jgi:AcrR family transcriptional regulator
MPSSINSDVSRGRRPSRTDARRTPPPNGRRRRNQKERSKRSRGQILDAALKLFSTKGYHGTSIRDIAVAARVSTGNVYHQFPDKETVFRTLLDRYWEAVASPDYPFNRALFDGAFPDDLEALGRAARETVTRYRPYIALIYVDVVEFEGSHIRKFYSDMASRFEKFLATPEARRRTDGRMRDGVSPLSAVMLTTRFLLHYFTVEVLFGVPDHFGKDTESVLLEIAGILSYGMLDRDPTRP